MLKLMLARFFWKLLRPLVAPDASGLVLVFSVMGVLNFAHAGFYLVGAFVFVSGLVAIDPATGERMHGTVATETRQILAAMTQVLEAAGSSLEKVVKANVLIYSMLEYNNMNEVYREFFPVDPPARTVCGAQLSGGSKVEIECIALA